MLWKTGWISRLMEQRGSSGSSSGLSTAFSCWLSPTHVDLVRVALVNRGTKASCPTLLLGEPEKVLHCDQLLFAGPAGRSKVDKPWQLGQSALEPLGSIELWRSDLRQMPTPLLGGGGLLVAASDSPIRVVTVMHQGRAGHYGRPEAGLNHFTRSKGLCLEERSEIYLSSQGCFDGSAASTTGVLVRNLRWRLSHRR